MHSKLVSPFFPFLCPSQVETKLLTNFEQQSQSAQPSTPQQPDAIRPHKALKCKVIIVAAFVFAALTAVSRTTMLIVLAYKLPRSCTTNGTHINSSDCAQTAAESDNRSIYFRVIELLYITFCFLTLPEYAVLAHGLYKLLVKTSNAIHPTPNQHPNLEPKADFKKLFSELCNKKLKHYKAWLGILLAFIFIFIFALISLATPTVGMIYASIHNKCCKEQQLVLIFRMIYHSLNLLVHLLSPVIRAAMVITVLEVKAIWISNKYPKSQRTYNTANELPDSRGEEDEKRAIFWHYKSVKEYEERVDKIKPLLRVFQTWFVFQWFHYFFQAITDLTQALHQWITGTRHPELIIAYRSIYVVYDILGFSIPHICGLKVNAYHQEYLRDERVEQLNAAQSKLEYVKAYSLTIQKSKYGDFVPRIRGTGIKIPLENTGYTLSILLTIFALAASFISFSM